MAPILGSDLCEQGIKGSAHTSSCRMGAMLCTLCTPIRCNESDWRVLYCKYLIPERGLFINLFTSVVWEHLSVVLEQAECYRALISECLAEHTYGCFPLAHEE